MRIGMRRVARDLPSLAEEARNEIIELRRVGDGHTQAVLRHGAHPLEAELSAGAEPFPRRLAGGVHPHDERGDEEDGQVPGPLAGSSVAGMGAAYAAWSPRGDASAR